MPSGIPLTEEDRQKIIDLRRDGHTVKDTAKAMGISTDAVKKSTKGMNLGKGKKPRAGVYGQWDDLCGKVGGHNERN